MQLFVLGKGNLKGNAEQATDVDGGRQVTSLCINPVTRHLYAGGGCRGMYKVALDQ